MNDERNTPMKKTALIGTICALALSARADVIRVEYDAGKTTNENGSALATALADAPEGSEIVLTAGTYSYTITSRIDPFLILDKKITIRGETGNPEDVVISRAGSAASKRTRAIALRHPEAVLSCITVQDGMSTAGPGANISIDGGGTVTNCIVRGGNFGGLTSTSALTINNSLGGGIALLNGGLVTHCVVTNNTAPDQWDVNNKGVVTSSGGCGVYIASETSIVRNCLIAGNYQTLHGGDNDVSPCGAVRIDAGLLESCTIAGNSARQCSGVFALGGTVRNCLVGANESTVSENPLDIVFNGEATLFSHCAGEMEANVHGTFYAVQNPFVNAEEGDYRPAPGTDAINTGEAQEWMMDATDLAGNPRIQSATGGRPDIGAYEMEDGAFAATFSADATEGIAPLTVSFTAKLSLETAGRSARYFWTFNDGSAEQETTDPTVTHAFTNPSQSQEVSLRVVDSDGVSHTALNKVHLYIVPKTMYCSSNGSGAWPYTEAKPTSKLSDVVNAAVDGCEIILKSGSYNDDAKAYEIVIDKAITIRGETGVPEDVIMNGASNPGARLFVLDHPSAKVSGMTLSWGEKNAEKGFIEYFRDAFLFLIDSNGGTVSNCVLRNVKNISNGVQGGAVHLRGAEALLTHCVISNNYIKANKNCFGSAVYLADGRMENCLLAGNYTSSGTTTETGGTVAIAGGRVVNCTIVGNSAYDCAGVYATGGEVVNTIIARNDSTTGGSAAVWKGDNMLFRHCLSDTTRINDDAAKKCRQGDPMFENPSEGNYRLLDGSAAANRGTMDGLTFPAFDLAGNDRVKGTIDLGCYESSFVSGFSIIFR